LTKGLIPVEHAWFNGIQPVVKLCTRPYTCFLGPTWVPIQSSILIGSAVFAQLTAELSYALQWVALSPLKGDMQRFFTKLMKSSF